MQLEYVKVYYVGKLILLFIPLVVARHINAH